MPCLSTGNFQELNTNLNLKVNWFWLFLQQLVAIFHGSFLPSCTISNCDLTKIWRWDWQHQPLPWSSPFYHCSYYCVSIRSSHNLSQSPRSSTSGIYILNIYWTFSRIVIFDNPLTTILFCSLVMQIAWGSAGLVITANIIVFFTILGFFVAFDNDDVDYSMWWEPSSSLDIHISVYRTTSFSWTSEMFDSRMERVGTSLFLIPFHLSRISNR